MDGRLSTSVSVWRTWNVTDRPEIKKSNIVYFIIDENAWLHRPNITKYLLEKISLSMKSFGAERAKKMYPTFPNVGTSKQANIYQQINEEEAGKWLEAKDIWQVYAYWATWTASLLLREHVDM